MRARPVITVLRLAGVAAYLVGVPVLVVWLSGNWRWVEGWIFGAWFAATLGTCLLWLYYKDPALLAERFRMPGTGGQSRTDLAILLGIKLASCAWFVLPPLDVRFHWTPRLPLWSQVLAGFLLLGGSFFLFRAFTDNPFLSPLVRIQTERRHHLVDTGVYGVVRHPMYLGASLMYVGGPLLLGSVCGVIVGISLVLLLVLRTFGEEKLLADDLEGYQEYRDRVRSRLLPGIW